MTTRSPSFRARLVGAVVAWLALAGCAAPDPPPGPAEPTPAPAPRRPNIVLVTIDTLRQDRTSCYGHDEETTPALDALARDGVRFANAYSTSSWTVPAIVSLLTALDPETHGIVHGHFKRGAGPVGQEVISESHALWPELLQRLGYRTYGVTANAHLQAEYGFARGFDDYRCVGFRRASWVSQTLKSMTPTITASPPYFLWVHYFDPHAPYVSDSVPVEPFSGSRTPEESRQLRRIQNFVRPEQFHELGLREDPRALAYTLALYDAEIRFADSHLERLLDALGVTADDLIIVTSDHGEEFLDHDDLWHGHSLYEEVIRVPMVVRYPGRAHAGVVVHQPVSIADLLPTVLDYLGADLPVELQGTSLAPLIRGESSEPRTIHTAVYKAAHLESLIAGGWKYVRDVDRPERSYLFDLEHDGTEQRNLLEQQPARAAEMEARLRQLLAWRQMEQEETRRIEISDERLEALRSLGYVR